MIRIVRRLKRMKLEIKIMMMEVVMRVIRMVRTRMRMRRSMMMMMRMVVAEWLDGAGGSSNDSGGLSDLKVNRTAVGISRTAARV